VKMLFPERFFLGLKLKDQMEGEWLKLLLKVMMRRNLTLKQIDMAEG